MKAITWVILVAYLCSACYSYVPVSSGPRQPGEPVRVYLSQPQTVQLDEITAGNIMRVDGEVAAVEDGGLVLSAFDLLSGSGAEYTAEGRTVRLHREAIESVEKKRFDWLRSAALLAAGVAAGVLFAAAEGELSGGGRPRPGPGTGR